MEAIYEMGSLTPVAHIADDGLLVPTPRYVKLGGDQPLWLVYFTNVCCQGNHPDEVIVCPPRNWIAPSCGHGDSVYVKTTCLSRVALPGERPPRRWIRGMP